MPSYYEMAQGPKQSLFDDWQAGKDAYYGDQQNKFTLAQLQRGDMARAFAGPALAGDQGAFSKLMALDPNTGLKISDQRLQTRKTEREMNDGDLAAIGKIAISADTPEKWQEGMDYLQSQGYQIDDEDRDFNNRQLILDATASGGEGFTMSPGASRYDANGRLLATAPGRPEGEAKRRTQVVSVGGRQILTDMDTGEPVRDLGVAPSRSRVANTDQNNAAGFYDRMNEADAILSLEDSTAAATDMGQVARSNVPLGVGNFLVSEGYQKFDQARRDFINAQLRKESGAAISPGEFDSANKQYFPQPGDSDAVIKQKANNRKTAIAAMKRTAAAALQQEQYPDPQPDMQGGATDAGNGQYFDNETDIPDGAVVEDDEGKMWRREGDMLVPVQ